MVTPLAVVPPYLSERLAKPVGGGVPAPAPGPVGMGYVWPRRWAGRPPERPPDDRPPGPGDGLGPRRTVDDAGYLDTLPGEVVRREGDAAIGDGSVDAAYRALGDIWAFLHEVHGRDSVDGRGGPLLATVRFGRSVNASWDGSQVLLGGGIDGRGGSGLFPGYLGVVAHAVARGMVQRSVGLVPEGQPGALGVSLGDVFSVLVEQHERVDSVESASWLVGDGLPATGAALRSVRDPGTAYDDATLGTDPQRGTMEGFVRTGSDLHDAHVNAGIPNRAFALAALTLGGHSWERAGRVWYDAVTSGELAPDAGFAAFAAATRAAARRRFGGGDVLAAVTDAWLVVGVA